MYAKLLAKGWNGTGSEKPPSHALLAVHLRAAQAAGEAIADGRGVTILDNLGLDPSVWMPRLRLVLSLAGLLHDLGKANSYFQAMVRGDRDHPAAAQPIRHELAGVLALLRNSGGVGDWLRGRLSAAGEMACEEDLFRTLVGAVAGHHLKLDCDWSRAFRAAHQGGGGLTLDLFLGHADLKPLFDDGDTGRNETWSLLQSDASYPAKSQPEFNRDSVDWEDRIGEQPQWRRFAAAAKALTVAADVAASALLPEGVSTSAWIGDALTRSATAATLEAVARKRLEGKPLRPFQQAIAASGSRITLVEAGCGSGKTAAAYLWAANRAAGRKLFFCYPTTGTATEGFLDYVAESDVEAALIHSRASVDLERMAMTGDGSPEEEGEDEQLRISSLAAWAPEAVVCTVDTILGLVRNNRRGLYGSPAILSGCFVLDEVHAYDDRMFSAVVALARALPGAPFLLMSASLPAHRKALLRRYLGEVGLVAPPAQLEAIPRYELHRTDEDAAFSGVAGQVHRGGRVLWVCNVVARAQAVYDRAVAAGLPVLAYHSRFRYRDRVDRHREVVARFAGPPGTGLLAVTTQVAEMSLDLDAHLLVTELAPVPALIQRMGRLNRRVSERAPGTPRPALIVVPDDERPYARWELDQAGDWIDRLAALSRPLSQSDLARQFRVLADGRAPHLDLRTEWLDSGWCATPGPIRSPGFTVNCLLPRDAGLCRKERKALAHCCLPMRYQPRMERWPRLHGAFVAPEGVIEYDQYRGAVWAE